MRWTDRLSLAGRGAGVLVLAAGLIACDTISDNWRKVTGAELNPLLQTQEGRIEIMKRCHQRAQSRFPTAASVAFAQGHLTNTDSDGDAEYLGAIEVTSPAGQPQRFRFVCRVQPDGAVDLRYI